jgi:hypothetical protein
LRGSPAVDPTRVFASGCAMFSNFLFTIRSYYAFYGTFFSSQWSNLSPSKYGILLIGVAIFGWLLMKAGNKRA